jgi:hypothetical protein
LILDITVSSSALKEWSLKIKVDDSQIHINLIRKLGTKKD